MAGEVLYTPEVLGLATSLSGWPLEGDLPLSGSARSRSCGSTLDLALALDGQGRIARIGLRAQACAIGQAAAAIFAAAAPGRDARDIAQAGEDIGQWLAGTRGLPDWPGLSAIEAAAAYPARHGAVLLAWQAASMALSTTAQSG